MAHIEHEAKAGSLAGLDRHLATAEGMFQQSLAAVKSARGI
jgi:hypothetical protein